MKWTPNNVSRNVGLFYLAEFFGNLDFARGIFVLFLLSRGISNTEIGILQTLLFWSNLLTEIPAGILADRAKRKYSIVAGLVLTALACFLMYYGQTFLMFAVTFVLHGMGFAFRSGADNALLYDGLKEAGPSYQSRFLGISARARGISNIAMGMAIALGGWLSGFGWDAVYFSFAACMILGAVVTLSLHESRAHETAEVSKQPGVLTQVRSFIKDPRGKQLLGFIFGMGFLEAIHAPFFIYAQVLLKDYGLSPFWIAVVIASSMGVTAIAYLFVDRLKSIPMMQIIVGGSLLTAMLAGSFAFMPVLGVAIFLFLAVDTIPSLVFVHTDNYINDQVPSEIRASMLSVNSFVSSIFISVTFLGGGYLLDHFSSSVVLGSLALLPLLGMGALAMLSPDKAEKQCVS